MHYKVETLHYRYIYQSILAKVEPDRYIDPFSEIEKKHILRSIVFLLLCASQCLKPNDRTVQGREKLSTLPGWV